MVTTMSSMLKYLNCHQHDNHVENNMSTFKNCVSSIISAISIFEHTKFNEEDFKKHIGVSSFSIFKIKKYNKSSYYAILCFYKLLYFFIF